MLTSLSTEELIPADHPIRKIRVVVDVVLGELDVVFDGMYAAGGRGKGRAAVAVGHTILLIAWHVLTTDTDYQHLGGDHFASTEDHAARTRRLVHALHELGHTVTLS
jgi:hypothetical protein